MKKNNTKINLSEIPGMGIDELRQEIINSFKDALAKFQFHKGSIKTQESGQLYCPLFVSIP